MGLGIMSVSDCNCNRNSGSDNDEPKEKIVYRDRTLPNPNPSNFKICALAKIGNYAVATINYPDCTNYEGNKILVYYNTTYSKLNSAKILDPHFCDSDECLSPIARFEPTDEGWRMAVKFARMMCSEQ